eukprot:gene4453-4878_t
MDFVRVEFAIRDVTPPKTIKRKKKKWTSGAGGGVPKTSQDAILQSSYHPNNRLVRDNRSTDPLVPEVEHEVEDDHEERRKVGQGGGMLALPRLPLRPKSANILTNKHSHHSESTTVTNKPAWRFDSSIDRERLLQEQDLAISSYRLQHSSIYGDSRLDDDDEGEEGEDGGEGHNARGNISKVLPRPKSSSHPIPSPSEGYGRNRILPQTSGTVRNNPLYQYPFLREDKTGIHPKRWSVMSIETDDPDRLKPVLQAPGKSQADFHRYFHAPPPPSSPSSPPSGRRSQRERVARYKDVESIPDLSK